MRIGHRRTILGLLGLPFIVYGVGILVNNGAHIPLVASVEVMADVIFGWLWLSVGVLAIMAMFASESYPETEAIGYGLLFIPPFLWMSSFLITFLSGGGIASLASFLCTGTIAMLILYLARYLRNS